MGGRSGQAISGDYSGITINDQSSINSPISASDRIRYVKLAGIPKDYQGVVSMYRSGNNINLEISSSDITMQRRFNSQEKTVYNELFKINPNGKYKGKGIDILKNAVDNLIKDKEYKKMRVTAAGYEGSIYNGYYTWLRSGYEGIGNYYKPVNVINSYLRANNINISVKSNYEINQRPELLKLWKKIGGSWEGEFTLDKNSDSYKSLTYYLKNRSKKS